MMFSHSKQSNIFDSYLDSKVGKRISGYRPIMVHKTKTVSRTKKNSIFEELLSEFDSCDLYEHILWKKNCKIRLLKKIYIKGLTLNKSQFPQARLEPASPNSEMLK